MKTLITILLLSATLCYGQSDTIYSQGSKRSVTIQKVTKNNVKYRNIYGEYKIPTHTVDSIYCHTSKVAYYETGGKEIKESLLICLTGTGIALMKTDEDIIRVIQIGTVTSLLVTSTVKFILGATKLQHYEPKPSTPYVMLRFSH